MYTLYLIITPFQNFCPGSKTFWIRVRCKSRLLYVIMRPRKPSTLLESQLRLAGLLILFIMLRKWQDFARIYYPYKVTSDVSVSWSNDLTRTVMAKPAPPLKAFRKRSNLVYYLEYKIDPHQGDLSLNVKL